jgi:hypothetical protein
VTHGETSEPRYPGNGSQNELKEQEHGEYFGC